MDFALKQRGTGKGEGREREGEGGKHRKVWEIVKGREGERREGEGGRGEKEMREERERKVILVKCGQWMILHVQHYSSHEGTIGEPLQILRNTLHHGHKKLYACTATGSYIRILHFLYSILKDKGWAGYAFPRASR